VRGRLRSRFGWKWFRGDYATWAAAQAASGGYADGAILDRILSATLAVVRGQAVFERDGVLFHEPEPDAPLLQALEEVRRSTGGGLRVLDFGGSLGSTYWRLRGDLPSGPELVWDVVEQSGFVEAGRKHLAGERVRFFSDVREAEAAGPHDVLLCSCVLQYLEAPARTLAEWRGLKIPFLLLNNLPLHAVGPDRLRVQHVRPDIYRASYPVWFFNRAALLARLAPDYEVMREFASEAVWPVDGGMYPSTGLLLKRRSIT
jgi:putative methyltransferase (TIGR04325 family)